MSCMYHCVSCMYHSIILQMYLKHTFLPFYPIFPPFYPLTHPPFLPTVDLLCVRRHWPARHLPHPRHIRLNRTRHSHNYTKDAFCPFICRCLWPRGDKGAVGWCGCAVWRDCVGCGGSLLVEREGGEEGGASEGGVVQTGLVCVVQTGLVCIVQSSSSWWCVRYTVLPF